jgi:hypothetical protein
MKIVLRNLQCLSECVLKSNQGNQTRNNFMKKICPLIFSALFFAVPVIHAQMANTKWKGILNMDGAVPVIWQFDKDTVQIFNISDSSLVEKMTYTTEPGFMFFTKVSGISSCDVKTIGKYKFTIRSDSLFIVPSDDPCQDRASAVSSEPCIRTR